MFADPSLQVGGELPADLLSGGPQHLATGPSGGERARFYMRTVRDEAATAAQGVPRHKSVVYLEIRVPGDKSLLVDRPVRDEDQHRFPREWYAFKAGDTEQVVGIPLSLWPSISAPRAEDLKAQKIRTIEELAAVSDANIQALGLDGRKLRDDAIAFLEATKGAAPLAKLQAELSKKDEEMQALRLQLAEVQKTLERHGKAK